jgi:murein DD-endopeptidase MepM/ murein hydrolase activator NlpD
LKRKKITALVLTLVMVFAAVPPAVSAATSSSSIQDQLQDAQNQLKEGQEKQNSLIEQIDSINSQISQIEEEISAADEEIAKKETEIQEAQENLDNQKAKISKQNNDLNERLRAMYKSGETGILEVLLGSSDITELISNLDMIQLIYSNDQKVLEQMKTQYSAIEDEKNTLEKLQEQLKEQQNEKKQRESELESKKADVEELEQQVAQDNEALEAQIDELNKEAQQITSEIQQGEIEASTSSDSTYSGSTMLWPVPSSHRITSEYGNRYHPILHVYKFHSGIDIGASQGSQILAANDGTVIYASTKGGYGNCVMIDHGGGVVTLYGHCSKLLVSTGEKVTRGQNIALVGSTGQSTGPHCHFEVRINGSTTNPMNYL